MDDDENEGTPVPNVFHDLSGGGESSTLPLHGTPDTDTDPYLLNVMECWPHRLKALAERVNAAAMKWMANVAERDACVRGAARDRRVAQAVALASVWDQRLCQFREAVALHNARQARKAAENEIASEAMLAYKVELAIRGGRPDALPTVMYDASRKRFLLWEGRWRLDTLGHAFDVVGEHVQQLTPAAKWNNAKVYNAVLQHLRAKPGLVTDGGEWDADPMLLGTPGGVVNLRTGELREYQLEDRVTKSTAVTPAPGKPERWLQFLGEATGGDSEFIRAMQKAAGYCLTGLTHEQVLVFVHGVGGTGKGTLMRVLYGLLKDYATEAADSVIEKRSTSAHPTDLMALKGARLVTVSETSQGKAWNDKRVQQFTGEDPITARGMGENFQTFLPSFKLVVIGNHAPKITGVSGAMKRRLRVFPFNRMPAQVDAHLSEKLRSEWPQILQWAIEGCLLWQQEGLGRFTAEREATSEFFESEDTIGEWLEELTERVEGAFTSSRDLVESYNEFRRHAGLFPVEQKLLIDDLVTRDGLARDKGGKGTRGVRGIKITRALSYRTVSTCEPTDIPDGSMPNNVVDLSTRKTSQE